MSTFSDVEYSLFDVKPTKIKRNTIRKNKSTSTEIKTCTNNTECQTSFDIDKSTQTNLLYNNNNVITLNSLCKNTLLSLKSFLNKVEPVIMDELKENIETQNIFNDYIVEWENAPNSVYLESKMCFKNDNDNNNDNNNMLFGGLCIDINNNNSRVAIGFGLLKEKHISWCLHSTHVVIWNVNNMNNKKENEYEHCIEISSCCTAIKYHPKYDNILCFGLFNGLISIYKLDNNGNSLLNTEICKSLIDDCYHKEIITDLCWLNNNYIISISIDGKLLIWDFQYNKLSNPIIGYTLIPTKVYNPNQLNNISNLNHTHGHFNQISITNIALPTNDINSFIIGTQCGAIINCLIDTDFQYETNKKNKNIRDGNIRFDFMAYKLYKNIKNKSNQLIIKRNIEKYIKLNKNIKIIKLADIFESNLNNSNILYPALNTKLLFNKKHIGFINIIQFSPFSRNIFLTSSLDGYVQVFSIFSSLPVIQLTFNNKHIFDSKWSPIRPCIIALINSKRELIIYDLFNNKPTNIIQITDNKNIKLSKLCFNNLGNKIFISDNIGNLYIYQLSNILIQHQPKEIKHLQKWTKLNLN